MTATAGSGQLEIGGTSYAYQHWIVSRLGALAARVEAMRSAESLSSDVLVRLRRFFRIKHVYHSNAIEGNTLNVGETRLVVEEGLTISGKPLKDSLEAKNLAGALDLLEEMAESRERAIREVDIRQIHQAVLSGVDDVNAGRYRTAPVEIAGSRFAPPGPESVAPQMQEFCRWLATATGNPIVLASAAHAWFVTIHPFLDGNGRTARLLMNLMLMRFGFPIAVITREDRFRYYEALEESQGGDLTPFLELIVESVEESIEQYEAASAEGRALEEWSQTGLSLGASGRERARSEYELWRSGLDLLKSYFRQSSRGASGAEVKFKDFGHLEFEKFLAVRGGQHSKKTWFFRVDLFAEAKALRYLFLFGVPSAGMLQHHVEVTLHVFFESAPFSYESLDTCAGNQPDVVEIGFRAPETFLFRNRGGHVQAGKLEDACSQFFKQTLAHRH
ncbi:MAG: Fic family protein [Bryobacteraceae bacterium]